MTRPRIISTPRAKISEESASNSWISRKLAPSLCCRLGSVDHLFYSEDLQLDGVANIGKDSKNGITPIAS
jgi:hypothetical protein